MGVNGQLFRTIVLEANYLGSAGHKLFNVVNLNRYSGDLATSPGARFPGFNPGFDSIQVRRAINAKLQLDAFNTFNRVNFNNPSGLDQQ